MQNHKHDRSHRAAIGVTENTQANIELKTSFCQKQSDRTPKTTSLSTVVKRYIEIQLPHLQIKINDWTHGPKKWISLQSDSANKLNHHNETTHQSRKN